MYFRHKITVMQSNVRGCGCVGLGVFVVAVCVCGSRRRTSKENLFINVGSQLPQNNKTKSQLPGHRPSKGNRQRMLLNLTHTAHTLGEKN